MSWAHRPKDKIEPSRVGNWKLFSPSSSLLYPKYLHHLTVAQLFVTSSQGCDQPGRCSLTGELTLRVNSPRLLDSLDTSVMHKGTAMPAASYDVNWVLAYVPRLNFIGGNENMSFYQIGQFWSLVVVLLFIHFENKTLKILIMPLFRPIGSSEFISPISFASIWKNIN